MGGTLRDRWATACRGCWALLAAAGIVCLHASDGVAASYWWNGVASTSSATVSSWDTVGNWSTSASSATAPTVKPGSADDIVYNINSKNGQNSMVSFSTNNQAANSLTFSSTGATVFVRSSSTNSSSANLTIGSGGITLSSTAGPVTFGEADKKVTVKLAGSATFTNNSPSLVAFVKSVEPANTSTSSYTLTLAGSGTGGFRFDEAIGNNAGTLALAVNTDANALVTLGTANTFTGGVTLTQGILGLGSSSALGSGAVTVNGGVIASLTSPRAISNNFTIGGNFTLGGQSNAIGINGTVDLGNAVRTITLLNSATFNGIVSNGGLIVNGSNAGSMRRLILNAANTYAAGTTLSSGTLVAGSADAFGSGAVTVASGASLDLGGYAVVNTITNNGGSILNAGSYAGTQTLLASATYASLSGASTLNVGINGKATINGSIAGTIATLAGGTAELTSGGVLTQTSVTNAGKFIFSDSSNASLSTNFSGAGSFQKDSGSILSLTGSSFFGAGMQITAGGLLVTGSVGGGTVSVAGNASLGGSGRIGGDVSFASGAKFNFVAGNTLTVGGSATFAGTFGVAGILGLDATTPDGTYTLISGAVNFTNVTNVGSGNAYSLGSGKSAYLQQGSLELVVVPEPATMALVCSAGLAVVLFHRRRG